MRNNLSRLAALAGVLLLAGCVTNYTYRADGEVTMRDGETHEALLYWLKDEGRTWYGWPYEQKDSTVHLRVCGAIVRGDFIGNAEGDPVELASQGGEFRVARLAPSGAIEPLPEPKRLLADRRCGAILVDDRPVSAADLEVGMHPAAAIFCRDDSNPGRYLAPVRHLFGPVNREETGDDRKAPSPCPDG